MSNLKDKILEVAREKSLDCRVAMHNPKNHHGSAVIFIKDLEQILNDLVPEMEGEFTERDMREAFDIGWNSCMATETPTGEERHRKYQSFINRYVSSSPISSSKEEIYVPGLYRCPKCDFIQSKNIIYAESGHVAADTSLADLDCPNDGEKMQQETWKDYALGTEKALKKAYAEIDSLKPSPDIRAEKKQSSLSIEEFILKLKDKLDLWEKRPSRYPGDVYTARDLYDFACDEAESLAQESVKPGMEGSLLDDLLAHMKSEKIRNAEECAKQPTNWSRWYEGYSCAVNDAEAYVGALRKSTPQPTASEKPDGYGIFDERGNFLNFFLDRLEAEQDFEDNRQSGWTIEPVHIYKIKPKDKGGE